MGHLVDKSYVILYLSEGAFAGGKGTLSRLTTAAVTAEDSVEWRNSLVRFFRGTRQKAVEGVEGKIAEANGIR